MMQPFHGHLPAAVLCGFKRMGYPFGIKFSRQNYLPLARNFALHSDQQIHSWLRGKTLKIDIKITGFNRRIKISLMPML
jgi:hypothetical protein